MVSAKRVPWWTWVWPISGAALLAFIFMQGLTGATAGITAFAVLAVVFAAVYHAEIIAHRVGEPFGTLVLALAVTVIEVALIVSIMFQDSEGTQTLARDTVFATVMIICNGLVGLCLLAGGIKHFVQGFQLESALAALAVLTALTAITLLLPNVTTSAPGAAYNNSQLVFAGVASLILYGAFIFVQTIRHRDYFLPQENMDDEETHAPPPTAKNTLISAVLLVVSLVVVVGLAKALSPMIEEGVASAGAPKAVVGILIAAVVLLPESLAAYRAARANRLQTSMNLALGSALATIGLTIPAVVAASLFLDQQLSMGLNAKEGVLLAVTLLLSVITVGTGRTTILQGIVHLVMFATFLFLTIVP
ncbi:MAG: ionic transporter y4hA [Micavibrio aeruginosavorus]|uniref:Ionic transporter y4hA n=1 Tax=Micavibrio aeruginosavorus TaxID=349221 RepID=A0A2W5MVR0_9BACT|nr:MAG: ionic transporter y4hA [Micavibrio aeruginosavorus]